MDVAQPSDVSDGTNKEQYNKEQYNKEERIIRLSCTDTVKPFLKGHGDMLIVKSMIPNETIEEFVVRQLKIPIAFVSEISFNARSGEMKPGLSMWPSMWKSEEIDTHLTKDSIMFLDLKGEYLYDDMSNRATSGYRFKETNPDAVEEETLPELDAFTLQASCLVMRTECPSTVLVAMSSSCPIPFAQTSTPASKLTQLKLPDHVLALPIGVWTSSSTSSSKQTMDNIELNRGIVIDFMDDTNDKQDDDKKDDDKKDEKEEEKETILTPEQIKTEQAAWIRQLKAQGVTINRLSNNGNYLFASATRQHQTYYTYCGVHYIKLNDKDNTVSGVGGAKTGGADTIIQNQVADIYDTYLSKRRFDHMWIWNATADCTVDFASFDLQRPDLSRFNYYDQKDIDEYNDALIKHFAVGGEDEKEDDEKEDDEKEDDEKEDDDSIYETTNLSSISSISSKKRQ